jgi:hypothetical protein
MKQTRSVSVSLILASYSIAGLSAQQASTPAPAPTPWALNVSGLVDGYYNFTNNHPASGNLLYRNFDVKANNLSLNMAKLALAVDPAPVGFRLDLGAGRAWDLFNFADTASGFDNMRYIPQAYLALKPAALKGMQIDVGKFYTSAGAELTETHLAWNYSRALMYANGPYYHFGLRTTMPVNKYFTAGFQLVNGWNNVEDNNSGKTMGFTTLVTMGKATWANTYYTGPENTGTNDGWRNFNSSVLAVSTEKANAYFQFDYGTNKIAGQQSGSNDWITFGGAAQLKLTPKFAITPRAEYYYDKDGFITGTAQKLKEFTLTGEYKFTDNFFTRLEYRRDWSDQAVFERGSVTNATKNQTTLAIGMVFFFDNYKVNLNR